MKRRDLELRQRSGWMDSWVGEQEVHHRVPHHYHMKVPQVLEVALVAGIGVEEHRHKQNHEEGVVERHKEMAARIEGDTGAERNLVEHMG